MKAAVGAAAGLLFVIIIIIVIVLICWLLFFLQLSLHYSLSFIHLNQTTRVHTQQPQIHQSQDGVYNGPLQHICNLILYGYSMSVMQLLERIRWPFITEFDAFSA